MNNLMIINVRHPENLEEFISDTGIGFIDIRDVMCLRGS